MVMLCFPKMRLMVVILTWFMLLNTVLYASIFWWRRMALSALTRSTMVSSFRCVNSHWRPLPKGLLVIDVIYSTVLSIPSEWSRREVKTYLFSSQNFLTVL